MVYLHVLLCLVLFNQVTPPSIWASVLLCASICAFTFISALWVLIVLECPLVRVCLCVSVCVCVCVAARWGLTNIISSLIWVSEQKPGGFERARRFPAAAARCWEKTGSCFPLVDSLAGGHFVAVNSTRGNESASCVVTEKRSCVFRGFLLIRREPAVKLPATKMEKPWSPRDERESNNHCGKMAPKQRGSRRHDGLLR